MIYLKWVGPKLFYYDNASCLCKTEIRAFIIFRNAMMRLCQPGTARSAWLNKRAVTVYILEQVLCAAKVIIYLDFLEVKFNSLS